MTNTFCLSFSDIGFQLLQVLSDENEHTIKSCHQFDYPSPLPPDQIFSPENLAFISDSVMKFRKDNDIENFTFSFALPFNIADIKKVAFPLQSDKTQKRQQMEWELKTTLSGALQDYKISVLNEKDESSFSSAVVVAIRKELLSRLVQISASHGTEISNVFLNCFALENYLLHSKRYVEDRNYAFLKVNKNLLEYHFFNGKQYFLSQIDSLDLSVRNRQEVILELTHERSKNISNLFNQALNKNPIELYLYGSSMDEEIFKVLRKGLSIHVEYAQIDNFPNKEDYKYIEAWGSIL